MTYGEVLKVSEDGRYRVKLTLDECPMEPYDDGQSPLLRYDYTNYGWQVEHIGATGRPTDDDGQIEDAARRWGSPSVDDFRCFEKYLRAYFGATQVETWHSGSYWYVTYDTARWREYAGAPANSVNMDEWKAYCEGDVWFYTVERNVTWHSEEDHEVTMETWEFEDSCGGYYGRDYAEQAALEAFEAVTASA